MLVTIESWNMKPLVVFRYFPAWCLILLLDIVWFHHLALVSLPIVVALYMLSALHKALMALALCRPYIPWMRISDRKHLTKGSYSGDLAVHVDRGSNPTLDSRSPFLLILCLENTLECKVLM